MGNYFAEPVRDIKAVKTHKCIWCGEAIEKGNLYTKQSAFFDGNWSDNKYHPECFDACCDSYDDEFDPMQNERGIPNK